MGNTDRIVYVVDDDPAIRKAVTSLVRSVGLEAKVFGSVSEFLEYKTPDATCCLVLDIRLPGVSGLDFQRQLADEGIHIPIIFITGHGDIPMSVLAMKAGAVEFLTKPFRSQELLDAVHVALERDGARRQCDSELRVLRERFESLTPREREVLSAVVSGKTNKQIAADLGVKEITVKVHRASVMQKMQAATLADLVRIGARLQLPL